MKGDQKIRIFGISSIFLTVLICSLTLSCSKDNDDTLAYTGKWEYHSSDPVINASYHLSYILIFDNKSFKIFDSYMQRLIDGGDNRLTSKGLTFTDPQNGETVVFTLIGLRDERLTVKTDFFGGQTTLVLKRNQLP